MPQIADIDEGADIIMVKPAMIYGDLIREIKDRTNVPMAAYSVSGEYAMIKGAASLGLIDEDAIICETAIAAKRAGTRRLHQGRTLIKSQILKAQRATDAKHLDFGMIKSQIRT